MKKKEPLEIVTIATPKELKKWLVEHSQKEGRSLTKQVIMILQEFRQTRLEQ